MVRLGVGCLGRYGGTIDISPKFDPPPPFAATGWAAALQPEATWEPPIRLRFAGLAWRVVAFAIDAGLIGLVWAALQSPTVGRVLPPSMLAPSILMAPFLYFAIAWGRFGTTVGMRLLGLRIVRSVDGGPIGYQAATFRAVLLAVTLITALALPGILFIIPAVRDRRRQTLHDRMSGTVVVRPAY